MLKRCQLWLEFEGTDKIKSLKEIIYLIKLVGGEPVKLLILSVLLILAIILTSLTPSPMLATFPSHFSSTSQSFPTLPLQLLTPYQLIVFLLTPLFNNFTTDIQISNTLASFSIYISPPVGLESNQILYSQELMKFLQ